MAAKVIEVVLLEVKTVVVVIVILVSHGSQTSYISPNITNIRASTRPISPTEKTAIKSTLEFENKEEKIPRS